MGRPESIKLKGPPLRCAQWGTKENGPPGGPREKRQGDLRLNATEEGWMCPLDPHLAGWGRSPRARSTTQLPTLGTLPGGAGEAASLVPKLPRSWGRAASGRALTGIISAARFPAPRPSSKGRRGPPLRRGEGPRTGPPLERSRGGSGARRIAPAAFGDFWPDKSRAPVPARGGYFPRRWRGSNSAQGALPVLRTEYSAAWSRFLQGAACAAICQAAARRN